MQHHLILKIVTKSLVGIILLFGLYVQFHGDYSPGGGFQAGVIFAAGFILYGVHFVNGAATEYTPLARQGYMLDAVCSAFLAEALALELALTKLLDWIF